MGIRRFGAVLLILTWLGGAPTVRVMAPDPETWEVPAPDAPAQGSPLSQELASAHAPRPIPVDSDRAELSGLSLPDLRTLSPSDLRIRHLASGRRLLRFSNTIINLGSAALEVFGEFNSGTRAIEVRQRLRISGATIVDRPIGRFIWHPSHGHWHIEEFALYQLWTITARGDLDELLSTSEKLSYCLIDTDPIDRQITGFVPSRTYRGCGRMIQGLSVGWGDEYPSYLEGQSIDVTGLPDGVYALVSIANPSRVLLESRYTNNMAFVYLAIEGDGVRLRPSLHPDGAICLADGKC
ncbi:MAG: lysyl oxidase family protein [Anaerolineales bacterium]